MTNPFDNPFAPRNALATLLGGSPPAQSPFSNSLLGFLEDQYRRRQEWNDRFTHWERRESGTETDRIERARNMVQQALAKNAWLQSAGVKIAPQGSFSNRTNTRLDADIDLRVQHPSLKIEHAPGVNAQAAYTEGCYFDTGVSFAHLASKLRLEIGTQLIAAFGGSAVDLTGKKAIRVKGLEGSRSEVDVVPCFTLHHVFGQTILSRFTVPGAAILSTDSKWTLNYPDQHAANGIAKRESTKLQFKRVVRIVKRLRGDMSERGILKVKVPSFLIECLVYLVEDGYFTVEADDRYDRVKRVLRRISEILSNGLLAYTTYEINGIKPLFGGEQAWSLDLAKSFVNSAIAHLGEA